MAAQFADFLHHHVGVFLASVGGTEKQGALRTKIIDDAKLCLWTESDLGAPICRWSYKDVVHAAAFAPSGKLLAIGGEFDHIHILAASAGNRRDKAFQTGCRLSSSPGQRCLSWSPCSRFLAAGGEDKRITVWDVLSQCIAYAMPEMQDWYCVIAFSPKGGWLASCCYDSSDVVLNPASTAEPVAAT
jgi:WD40 repeat protein